MSRRTVPLLLWVLLGLLTVIGGYLSVATTSALLALDTRGVRETFVNGNNPDSVAVLSIVSEQEFSGGPVPSVGDTVVAIDGRPIEVRDWIDLMPKFDEAGLSRQFTVRGDSTEWTVTWTLTTPEAKARTWTSFYSAVQILLTFLFFGIAAWLLVKQARRLEAQLLVLFQLSMGATLAFAVHFISVSFRPGTDSTWLLIGLLILVLVSVFKTGAWLHLCLVFPSPPAWLERRRWLAPVLSYGLLLPGAVHTCIGGLDDLTRIDLSLSFMTVYMTAIPLAQVIGGVVSLARKRKSPRLSALQRRQVTVILFGAGFGMLLLFTLTVLVFAGMSLLQSIPLLGFLYAALVIFAVSLIPVSFIYAFGRYRLLEMEARIRRGTRLGLINGALGLIVGVLTVLLFDAIQPFVPADSASLIAIIALILGFGVFAGYRKLQARLEHGLFPESERLRALIEELQSSSASHPSLDAYWRHLSARLRESVGSDTMDVAWYDEDGQLISEKEGLLPVRHGEPLDKHLRSLRKPFPVDELLGSDRVSMSEEEAGWLACRPNDLLLPLPLHGEVQGVITLCFPDRHDGLRASDLTLLRQLAQQVALQAENLRLLEDTLDKQRLAEQLEMAKQVQQGFLPREFPHTPGLTVTAECISSLEVAGDYYDVIALPNDRTLLAIADVSGKGAGAAMIMANLQAALRTVADLGHGLGDVVARINVIIHRNTTPEQYVTFFAAIHDPHAGTLTAVNAGHNPPYIQRADGTLSEIHATGPILGVIPGVTYDEATIPLTSGDRLVAFTDGVTEAMDGGDEEFGEARLETVLRECRVLPGDGLLGELKQRVDQFRGDVPLGDDFTVLLADVGSNGTGPSSLTDV